MAGEDRQPLSRLDQGEKPRRAGSHAHHRMDMTNTARAAEPRQRRIIALAFVAVIGWAHAVSPANAQAPTERTAVAHMIDHTIECMAYFTIVALCIRNKAPSDELAVRYDHLAQQAQRLG